MSPQVHFLLNIKSDGDAHPAPLIAGSATGQPCLICIIARGDLRRLHVCNIVVTEVDVLHVRSWLVVTRDVRYSGDGVLLSQHPQCQHGDEAERLAPLVAHQTHGALVHYMVQSHQALIPFVLHPCKVVLQVGLQLPLLFTNVREVNEEPTQGRGIKPLSGASPRIKVVRLSDGEGEARRKAGLMECSESLLLLLLLNGGQGGATGWRASCGKHQAEREGSEEAAAGPETSRSRGVVFGVAGGHSP
ncbi:hypothetical protein F7725_018672 [Dissostichus mawsoni]|uniref:Uncharacterized protein n=1 Tax=Dissostichus mawsoni TaxID=36200 RepID=A0A7J5XS37_DISMA|nr:hypothetical protein F7725_018672 [Dissostichus mawsoni]